MDKISIIVPCFNEQEALPIFYESVKTIADKMKMQAFEFLFINDGSKDGTLQVLMDMAKNDERVKYLSFSRNFGKEAAMYAGLKNAAGDYIAIMDADMQDPPDLIPKMYDCITKEGYDCAAARRTGREGEPAIRSFFARCFYRLTNKISNINMIDGARDFRLMTRQMTDAILSMSEYNRFSKGIFGWVGFDTKWIDYVNVNRVAGETKWSFWKLCLYSLEGIVSFSTTPLAIASVIGIIFCIVAFIWVCFIVIKTLVFGDPVSGWPSLASLICFVGGLQLLCIGILGQYLAKTYMETKKRPPYIIKQSNTSRV